MIVISIIVAVTLVISPFFLVGILELTTTPTQRVVIRRRRRRHRGY